MSSNGVDQKLCTKCKTNPRVNQNDDATNRHCQECINKTRRAWEMSKMEQANGKGFGRGVEAMRSHLSQTFYGYGSGNFSGYEIADLIRQAELPPKPDEAADEKPDGQGAAA